MNSQCILVLSLFSMITQTPAGVFVAPNGNDANDGTLEKPFATLEKARDAVRLLPSEKKQIIARGGTYYDVGLELTEEDSGLVIDAAPGEKPLLYGGVLLSGWEKDGDQFYSAPLPAGHEKAEVRLLEVGGVMAPRARYPGSGRLTHESTFKVKWMSTSKGGWERKPTEQELTTLRYKAGDLGDWLDLRSAEITVYHMWDESCVGLAANDISTRTLRFASAAGHPPGAFGVKDYVVWNVREGLTSPGQWFHDRTRNRIVYWPLPGQNPNQTPIIAGTRETILRLRGTEAKPVTGVTLRGLSFSATTVPLLAAGFASVAFDGAVSLENAESCTVDHLTVTRVAGHAVKAQNNCRDIHVLNSELAECGAGGLYVGGDGAMIENNLVHDVGLISPSAIGIFNRGGKNGTVRHNEVHHTSYSAIGYCTTENTIIESNLLYDCMKILHDGAAVYLGDGSKNCTIRGNLARDVTDSGGYGASAYYLDERCEDCVVENNLSVRVNWPFHNHMALKNTIRNNVAIVEGDAQITFPKSSDYTFEGNVIYATGKNRIIGDNAVTTWKNNIFFSQSGKVDHCGFEDQKKGPREKGVPEGCQMADPQFVDWAKGDYNYQPNSPVLALGLKAIDAKNAGRR